MAEVPPLEPHCNSWVVSRKDTGEAVAELYVRGNVERVNSDRYTVETSAAYLARINRQIRSA